MIQPQEKLEIIASYLAEQISESNVQIQPFQEASPVYELIIKTPKRQHRLGVCRPLIEDQNHSLNKVRALLLRDNLAREVQAFDREEYYWAPV